jgi:hypothetical protein
MTSTELKMQPTIHLQRMQSKPEYGRGEFALQMYCGLHFQFHRGHLITREIPVIFIMYLQKNKKTSESQS